MISGQSSSFDEQVAGEALHEIEAALEELAQLSSQRDRAERISWATARADGGPLGGCGGRHLEPGERPPPEGRKPVAPGPLPGRRRPGAFPSSAAGGSRRSGRRGPPGAAGFSRWCAGQRLAVAAVGFAGCRPRPVGAGRRDLPAAGQPHRRAARLPAVIADHLRPGGRIPSRSRPEAFGPARTRAYGPAAIGRRGPSADRFASYRGGHRQRIAPLAGLRPGDRAGLPWIAARGARHQRLGDL